MTTRLLTVSLLGLLAAGLVRADVTSGPKGGEKVATLKVYAVTGEPKDKEVDYAAFRKDKPTVYVFVSAKDFSRPMFRFLKKLDEDLGDDGLVVAVWLTDDADKSQEYLPKIWQYFKSAARRALAPSLQGPSRLSVVSIVRSVSAVDLSSLGRPSGSLPEPARYERKHIFNVSPSNS